MGSCIPSLEQKAVVCLLTVAWGWGTFLMLILAPVSLKASAVCSKLKGTSRSPPNRALTCSASSSDGLKSHLSLEPGPGV